MKLDYNRILDDYVSINSDLENIFNNTNLTIVTEAGGSTSNTAPSTNQSVNSTKTISDKMPNQGDIADKDKNAVRREGNRKIGDIIKQLVDKIKIAMTKFRAKLTNKLKLLSTTDKGFINALNKRKRMIKLPPALKIVNYQYNDNFFKQVFNTVTNDYNKRMNILMKQVNMQSQQVNLTGMSATNMIKDIMKHAMGTEMKSVNEFLNTVRDKFRGEKKEFLYKSTMLPQIEQIAVDRAQVITLFNKYKLASNNFNNALDKTVQIFKYKNKSEDESSKCKSILNTASQLKSFYDTFISYHLQLNIERCMSYREIVKKFYQF